MTCAPPAPAPAPDQAAAAPADPAGHPAGSSAAHLLAPIRAVPRAPRLMGLAGLAPMALALVGAWFGGPRWHYVALALAHGYGALILSFLGGAWWALAARAEGGIDRAWWPYALAVAPSLVALATFWPWAAGGAYPVPSLVVVALALWFSPLVDVRLARAGAAPGWWLGLRWPLSLGLGVLTLATALAA